MLRALLYALYCCFSAGVIFATLRDAAALRHAYAYVAPHYDTLRQALI